MDAINNTAKEQAIKALAHCVWEHANWPTEETAATVERAKAQVASFDVKEEAKAENVRHFGFFVITNKRNGETSVQLVSGSAREGFATEKTAQNKLNATLARYEGHKFYDVKGSYIKAFSNNNEMYKFLNGANVEFRM